MKYLTDSGEIGKLYHIYIKCIKDSGLRAGRRLEWRYQIERAGSGNLYVNLDTGSLVMYGCGNPMDAPIRKCEAKIQTDTDKLLESPGG